MTTRNKVVYFFLLYLLSCKPSTNKPTITGFWELCAFDVQDSASIWSPYAWNQGGNGFLLYDGNGHVAIHFTPKNYKDFKWKGSSKIDSMQVDELREALTIFTGNYNYMAEYTLDTSQKIVQHKRLSHSRPEDWGKTVQRRYAFVGNDTLLLYPVEGEKPRRLTWVRVCDDKSTN